MSSLAASSAQTEFGTSRNQVEIPAVPTSRDFLNKVYSLIELKTRFSSLQASSSFTSESPSLTATESALAYYSSDQGFPLAKAAEVFQGIIGVRGPCWRLEAMPLFTQMLENEKAFPHSVVAYHGNESTLLHDVYGSLAQILKIASKQEWRPLPRINARAFDCPLSSLLISNSAFKISMDWEFREIMVSASPTLISDIFDDAENALAFYLFGENIAKMKPHDKIQELIEFCGLEKGISFEFYRLFAQLQIDFRQNGYIWQLFFHDAKSVDQLTYPSKAFGRPLLNPEGLQRCTTSEFLSVLKSGNAEQRQGFQQKYKVDINDVQLRILTDPKAFLDSEKVGVHCFRRIVMDEQSYHNRISGELMRLLFEAALAKSNPAGLFSLSPLAKLLGDPIQPLARLANYVFCSTTQPKMRLIEGDLAFVVDALQKRELLPTSTFGTEETALEIALLSGQKEIFIQLFEMFQASEEELSQSSTNSLLSLTFEQGMYDCFLWLQGRANSPTLIDQWLLKMCDENMDEPLSKLLEMVSEKYQDGFEFDSFHRCMSLCVEESRKSFEILLKHCIQRGSLEQVHETIELLFTHAEFFGLLPEDFSFMMGALLSYFPDRDVMEQKILKGRYEYIPSRYQSYYQSLLEADRLKLPLQGWWKKGSAN